MEIKILATTGRAQGEAVQVRATKFFIGRHDNCQLRPDIANLAGIHALIEQRGNGLHLRDFGAEGGTGLNDRVLHAREAEVFDGDLIQIGPMVLTLSVLPKGGGPRAHHSAPDGWPFVGDLAEVEAPEPRRAEVAALAPIPERHPEPILARFAPAREPVESTSAATATVAPPAPRAVPAARPAPASPLTLPSRPNTYHAIACETIDGVLVAKVLPPELNEEASVSPFRYELRNLLDGEAPGRMVIDLGNTRYLSSRAVGVILAHYQAVQRQGGVLRVSGVCREVKPVLDQMRLSMLIDIYPTVAEAVQDAWD